MIPAFKVLAIVVLALAALAWWLERGAVDPMGRPLPPESLRHGPYGPPRI